MATRRSKRSHHEDDASDAMSVTDGGHPVKPAAAAAAAAGKAGVGQRRALNDVTNKNRAQHTQPAAKAASAALVEQVEEGAHVQTRAQQAARSSKAQEPSAKKMRFNGSEHAANTRQAQAATRHTKAAAPKIQLGTDEDDQKEAEEDEEADDDVDMADEEMKASEEEEEYIEDRDNSDVDESADASAYGEEEDLVSAKSSAGAGHTTAVAAGSAVVPATAPVAFQDLASWQQCLDDPCQEYADSIYQHLRTTEMLLFPDPIYMDKVQRDLTHAMRSILIDWLCEVAQEYHLKSQTLFLAVSYVDRFLSLVPIDRSKLQLVGITSMLVAAKYWEIWPPAIDEMVYISDKTYSKEEVLAMENSILITLKFKLTSPTSWEFSRRFCRAADADKRTEVFVDYLLELMLQESPSLTFRPSIIAASALFLALYTLHITPWSERLEIHTGIRVEELQTCVRVMHTIYVKTCVNQNTLKAVKDKYTAREYLEVAHINPRNM